MASLKALLVKKESQIIIKSPAVGYYSLMPGKGTFLSGNAFIGKLRILNSFHDLYLPENVFGKVIIEQEKDKMFYVEYGQELFRLNPEKALIDSEQQIAASELKKSEKLEQGFLITAFTTGIFYRRSSPDAPSYVEEGQRIEKGKVLGLIEVMKTFNHIVFQGTDKSDSGVIKKIFCDDAQEVKLGEWLFVIE